MQKSVFVVLTALGLSAMAASASPTPPWGAPGCQPIRQRSGRQVGAVCPTGAGGVHVAYWGHLTPQNTVVCYRISSQFSFACLPMVTESFSGEKYLYAHVLDSSAEYGLQLYFQGYERSSSTTNYDSDLGANYYIRIR